MKSMFHGLTVCPMAVLALLADSTSATERLVGLAPHDGLAVFAKAFTVSSGQSLEGVMFKTDGTSVTFPRVSILRGPASYLHEATEVALVEDVASGTGSTVTVSWPSAIEVTESGTYYVVVQLPVAAIRLGLMDQEAPNGTYIASVDEDELVPVVGELDLTLLPIEQSVVVDGGDVSKSEAQPSGAEAVARTFLRSGAPNPMNRTSVIDFGLERPGLAKLTIYDVSGREVRRLLEGNFEAGLHLVQWDGRDNGGRNVAAGVYLVNLRLGDKLLTERVVVTK